MEREDLLKDSDWVSAFEAANHSIHACAATPHVSTTKFSPEDVMFVYFTEEGQNDGPEWMGVFLLNDGRFVFVAAGCDFTGWECQSGGWVCVSDNLEDLIQFGLTNEARNRLGLNEVDVDRLREKIHGCERN